MRSAPRPKLTPGPSHPIRVEPSAHEVVVRINGQVIGRTLNALTLRESTYPPVQYIPREDVDMARLQATDHSTYCPYKGEASYFSIVGGGESGINAVWSYENPHDAVSPIRDHLAFYPDRVDIEEE